MNFGLFEAFYVLCFALGCALIFPLLAVWASQADFGYGPKFSSYDNRAGKALKRWRFSMVYGALFGIALGHILSADPDVILAMYEFYEWLGLGWATSSVS